MKKQTVLTLQWAVFFIFVIVAFGMIVLTQKGNLFLYPQIEKKLNTYFQEHYLSIKNEVSKSELKYSYQEKSYYFLYKNKQNENLSFQLTYTKNKKIKSTYQQDYVKGQSFLNKLCEKFEKEIQKLFKQDELSTIQVERKKNMTDFKKKEKQQLLLEKEQKKVAFYQIRLSTSLFNLNAKEMRKKMQTIDAVLKKNGYQPLTYQVTFTLRSDGTKGFIVKNITRDVLASEKLETILNTLSQTKQNKDENTKIEMEELK